MHAVRHVSLPSVSVRTFTASLQCRKASLTSAISAGVRKTDTALRNAEAWRRRQERQEAASQTREDEVTVVRRTSGFQPRQRGRDQLITFLRQGSENATTPDDLDNTGTSRHVRSATTHIRRSTIPTSIPFTTAGSEFLYGTHSVLAALRAGRRKFYKLYIYIAQNEFVNASDAATPEIVRLAKRNAVEIQRVSGDWLRLLDKISDRRPHNGLVLEASPLPILRIRTMLSMTHAQDSVRVDLDVMSQEERQIANIENTLAAEIPNQSSITQHKTEDKAVPDITSSACRFPLFLWLDRVTDTGNLGAILRTVHYFGVDGVIIPNHGTAPLSAVTVKASAGAAETVPILIVKDEKSFIARSKENGWKVFAAVSAQRGSKKGAKRRVSTPALAPETLRQSPCILALGNEAEGLRPWLVDEADHHLTIKGAQSSDDVVDSLNVSVAAALLIDRMLPKQTGN